MAQAHFEFNSVLNPSDSPRAGDPLEGLTVGQIQDFNIGALFFGTPHSVQGTEPGAPVNGLGPRFNHSNCLACHAHPAAGGSSPPVNPEVAIATQFGARNKIPFFITLNGPIREARFRYHPDGSPDGGVYNLFTISGRADAVGCEIEQPDFDREARRNNLSFRIPTPIFGGGLIEQIPDSEILSNLNANLNEKLNLGILGHENRSNNDGTITRFGWKAQNSSLEIFAGEAYNVEQGVTNDLFQSKRNLVPGCNFNPLPEDTARFDAPPPLTGLSAVKAFSQFSKFLAPPHRGTETSSTQNGERLFQKIGCALCHTPTLHTGATTVAALDHKPVHLFSDLLVHHLGPKLADYISQGKAGPDEFRTAPLWGVGQRLFFLHDGRTSSLLEAIQEHASSDHSIECLIGLGNENRNHIACHSEANQVIRKFNRLSKAEKEDLLNFLRIL